MKKKITTKMFGWILGGTLLSFVMFNMANYFLSSQAYSERLTLENQSHTRNVAFSVASFYESAYQVIGEMAQAQEIKSMNAAQQQAFISDRFSQYGYFDNLAIQRVPDGEQTARVRGEKATRPERWWFRKVMADKRPLVSPSFYSFGVDSNTPTTVTGIFFPVMQGDTMLSLFAAFLRVDEVQERVGRHYGGDDRYTYILDEEGTVVAHPEWGPVKMQHNYKNGTQISVARDEKGNVVLSGQDYRLKYEPIHVAPGLQKIVEQVLNGESGTAEYVDIDGDTMICSYAPVKMPGYGASWAALTVQDKTLAMAPLQQGAKRNAALSFIVLAGLAAMILRQSREVESGAQRLEETNAALEEEVCERTRAEADLTGANEELTAMNEEMVTVTDKLQQTNKQIMVEIDVRQAAEMKLRLRERQYHAMTRLIADNNAGVDTQMQRMLDSALELVEATDGYIVLIENGSALIRYAQGNRKILLGQELPTENGLFSKLQETGKLQYIQDYQNLTAIMFPLKWEEKVVGGLTITWQDEVRPLLNDEIEMLQQFADLASLALQGFQLRDELKRQLLERETLHEKISQMAYHDILTGLPNRAYLAERLKVELEAVAQGKTEGVIMFIDLDDLKSINDNFGHSAGDRLIIAAGKKIKAIAGERAFVARLGGDEFIIVLSERLEMAEIAQIGDRLVEGLCQEYSIADEATRVSASVGIATYPRDGNTVEELMKKADNAMYAAKAAGRNCWRFFDPVMLRDAQEKMMLTNSLRRALERGELRVAYQPQVDLNDGRVVGFEALLRWHSKEHGVVPPTRFIPLAEQNQLIVPIGKWVLQQACAFALRLSQSGYPEVRVAVNLSPKQLADESLIEDVGELIKSFGIKPQQMELEITESALLASMEDSSRKLHQLDALGVRLALDDFGTGYSSLTYLRVFPVETLKIDKSFIDNIPERETVLVQSLIRFAQSLDMSVVAEGVERQEQLDFLRNCGCDIVQGYFMSRPVPEADAIQFLLAKNSAENGEGFRTD